MSAINTISTLSDNLKLHLSEEEKEAKIEVRLNDYFNRTKEINLILIESEVRKTNYVDWNLLP